MCGLSVCSVIRMFVKAVWWGKTAHLEKREINYYLTYGGALALKCALRLLYTNICLSVLSVFFVFFVRSVSEMVGKLAEVS